MGKNWPAWLKRFLSIDQGIEFRPVNNINPIQPGKKAHYQQFWMRFKEGYATDPSLQNCLLAYSSDYYLLGTALLPHGDKAHFGNMQLASLDHAMWFHRDFNAGEWFLYNLESPSSTEARALCRGSFFSEDGQLIATVMQEGLMRKWEEKIK